MAQCFEFKDKGECKYGDQCRFPHIDKDGTVVSKPAGALGEGAPSAGENGNWQCIACNNVNFFHRVECNRCQARKPASSTDDGSWPCPECKNVNYPHRTHCNRCKIPKPAPTAAELNQQAMGGFGGDMGGFGRANAGAPDLATATRQFLACFQSYDPIESAIVHLMNFRAGAQQQQWPQQQDPATAQYYQQQQQAYGMAGQMAGQMPGQMPGQPQQVGAKRARHDGAPAGYEGFPQQQPYGAVPPTPPVPPAGVAPYAYSGVGPAPPRAGPAPPVPPYR